MPQALVAASVTRKHRGVLVFPSARRQAEPSGRLTDEARIVFFGSGRMGDDGLGYGVFTDEWLETK